MGEISNEIKRQLNKISQRHRRCDLTSYYEELEELKEAVKEQIAIRDKATTDYDAFKPKLGQLDSKRKELDKEVEDLNSDLAGFQDVRDKHKIRRDKMDNVIKKMKVQIASLKANEGSLRKDIEAKGKIMDEKMAPAMKASERVETERTPADLRKDYESLKVRIQETENQLGNVDELKRRLKERKRKYRTYLRDYNPLKKMHRLLSKMCDSQNSSYLRTKTQMGRTLVIFFAAMAKQRGYEGRLLLDFSTKELYYFVCPDGHSSSKILKAIDAQQDAGRGISEQLTQNKLLKKTLVDYSLGLSGGERSFATICFIMALWQVMECPFYMLDEFDVFMDAFNRKTSQLALMTHAKKFSMNQFVLFTPLDLGEVPSPEDACVLRLFPPVRGVAPRGEPGSNVPANDGSQIRHETYAQSSGGRNSDSSVENVDPLGGTNSNSQRDTGAKPGLSGSTNRRPQAVVRMGTQRKL